MKLLAFALLLAASAPARALDPWAWEDTAWEAGAVAALALDWGTTRDAAWKNSHVVRDGLRHSTFGEANPILGRHPSMRQVDAYFASLIVSHVTIAAMLPDGWRRGWQASAIGLELVVWGGNLQAGLSVRF